MQFSGERVVEGGTPKRIWVDHVARYEFASRYVKEKNVLDIACGTGYGSKILHEAEAAYVTGVDVSHEAIDFACTKYKINGLKFKVGNIQDIDFPENIFDVITCFETIEHIQNQRNALGELHRVLKPEGVLIISSPNRRLTSPFKSIFEHSDNPFHEIEYTTEEFIKLIQASHFEILEVYGQRGLQKVLLVPCFERLFRKTFPWLYSPEKGNQKLEKVSSKKAYRYITVVCKKLDDNKL